MQEIHRRVQSGYHTFRLINRTNYKSNKNLRNSHIILKLWLKQPNILIIYFTNNLDKKMIRRLSQTLFFTFTSNKLNYVAVAKRNYYQPTTRSLSTVFRYHFSDLPKHQVLQMPALSPTMSEGKIIKWNKKIGDPLEEGDIICDVETDKATVGFEVTEKGFLAQVRDTDKPVPVGTPVVVIVKKKDDIKNFADYKFEGSAAPAKTKTEESSQQKPKQPAPTQTKSQNTQQSSGAASQSSYPKHNQLTMPALSPTMTQGKIVKWNIKQGQQYSEGDSLCDIETDKATVAYQATQKGILAKILAGSNSELSVGAVLGLSVKRKEDVDKFKDYKAGGQAPQKQKKPQTQEKVSKQQKPSSAEKSPVSERSQGGRIFASPAAKTLASQKNINLSDISKGSGPQGRILRQDIQSYKPSNQPQPQKQPIQPTPTSQQPTPKPKPQKLILPQNPFEQVPLTSMRKTIAARLTESKTTIPHYYIQASIEMDKANALRTQLNSNEKQNGVKISVNDIIVKAMALALRDFPNVNSQWHGNVIKKFRYADVSVAVATENGLITPIVFRADTLGLLDIARRTKDIAKRARQGKLDPREYIGGTTTVSNIGMFGIDSVTSVINPPQSTIVGVGKTQKRILFDQHSTDPSKPYRVGEVMQVIVSADHRVVDGAVAAQWLSRIKKYLQNPSHMLL